MPQCPRGFLIRIMLAVISRIEFRQAITLQVSGERRFSSSREEHCLAAAQHCTLSRSSSSAVFGIAGLAVVSWERVVSAQQREL